MQKIDNSINIRNGLPFCAGLSLAGSATVSVLLFEKEEYSHSTSHSSSFYLAINNSSTEDTWFPRQKPLDPDPRVPPRECFSSTSHFEDTVLKFHFVWISASELDQTFVNDRPLVFQNVEK